MHIWAALIGVSEPRRDNNKTETQNWEEDLGGGFQEELEGGIGSD